MPFFRNSILSEAASFLKRSVCFRYLGPCYVQKKRYSGMLNYPENEPLTNFEVGSPSRSLLEAELSYFKNNVTEVPLVINGKTIYEGKKFNKVMPSKISHVLANYCEATDANLREAIDYSIEAQKAWAELPMEHRLKVFLKASHLIRTKYRYKLLAATMLGQAKNAFQGDIDTIAELIDFIEFNAFFSQNLQPLQKLHQPHGQINSFHYRPLEGFVAAISPFNFTAIGGNLCTAPAMVGNVVLFKPSPDAILASYIFYQILLESGLPKNIIQFVPSSAEAYSNEVIQSPHMAAVNFTGSSETFKIIWKNVGNNIDNYRAFPKLIGECGGKNYHFVHSSSDVAHVINSTIRAAFEYSGQKCSACARIYLPKSKWPEYRSKFLEAARSVKLGQPEDYDTFLSAVINKKAFDKVTSYLDLAKSDPDVEVLFGGNCNESEGYFIEPTILVVNNPEHVLLKDEIFGPVLSIHVYEDDQWKECIHQINSSSKYGLTGSVFSDDRDVIVYAEKELVNTSGNFYINDKSTGSVVSQQPFGGARQSGTNDKAGMFSYVMRFTSPRSIKEGFVSLDTFKYPYME